MHVKSIAILASSFALFSCTAMHQMAGLGIVREGSSSFDGARTVTATPNIVVGSPVMLGASYSSNDPNNVLMTVDYSSSTGSYAGPLYVSFSGSSINIDGTIRSFAVTRTDLSSSAYNTVSRKIYTESSASFLIPISYLRRMIDASDCRIRFETSRGAHVGQFHKETNGGVPAAKATMREFLSKLP